MQRHWHDWSIHDLFLFLLNTNFIRVIINSITNVSLFTSSAYIITVTVHIQLACDDPSIYSLLHCTSFERRNHQLPVDSHDKVPLMQGYDGCCVVSNIHFKDNNDNDNDKGEWPGTWDAFRLIWRLPDVNIHEQGLNVPVSFDPSGAETRLFWDNDVNTKFTDVLSCSTRPSSAMFLYVYY